MDPSNAGPVEALVVLVVIVGAIALVAIVIAQILEERRNR